MPNLLREAVFGAAALVLAGLAAPAAAQSLSAMTPEALTNYRYALDLCGQYVGVSSLAHLTPGGIATTGARERGLSRAPASSLTQVEDHRVGYEVMGGPGLAIHVKLYDYPAGRTATCTVFLYNIDHAGHRALAADFVSRSEAGDAWDWHMWRAWERSPAPSNSVKWERENSWTRSRLTVSAHSTDAATIQFRRVDPPGVANRAFYYGLPYR